MADIVNVGTAPNSGDGDTNRDAWIRVNQRFQQLLGTLSQITWAPGSAISATPLREWTVVGGQAYVAATNHIAGATFAADLAAGRWLAVDLADFMGDMAAPGGATIVGADDGASGALWSNVQEALTFFAYRTYGDATFWGTGGNDTAALQAFINANRGKDLVVRGLCSFSGVALVGSTYNRTRIHFEHARLLPAPAQFTNNFQAVWAGIAFQQVDRPTITGFFDGNRAAQQAREQTISICIAGCTNVEIPYAVFHEIRGDGVYIGQANLTSSSANTVGVHMGKIIGWNSAPGDGRNLVSHVSGDNVTCDDFVSIDVGGTIGGFVMPGGWDTEPDQTYQSCNGVQIGRAFVRHRGTCGLAFQGRPTIKNTRNVTVGVAHVVNDCLPNPSLLDQFGNQTLTGNQTLLVKSVDGFACENHRGEFTGAHGIGVAITDSDYVKLKTRVSRVQRGGFIGNDDRDVTGPGVRYSDIYIEADNIARYGIETGKLFDCDIRGKLRDPRTTFYTASVFGVFSLSYAQTDVRYSVDVKASANWVRSYRNDTSNPATYTNVVIQNCDLSGTWAGFTNQVGDMRVLRHNVRGVTEQTSAPSVGTLWLAGQQFANISGVVGQPRGWTISSTNTLVSWGNL